MGGDLAGRATPTRERYSAFPRGNKMPLFLPLLIWLQQIDRWCNARPILERLGQMRRLDRPLICQLGDTLRDGEHARNLLSRQLELPDRGGEQALARTIQLSGGSWPAAGVGRAGDQLLVWLATPAVSVAHALLGVGMYRFDDQVGHQCRLKRRPSLPGDDRRGCAATREVGVAGVGADARRRDVGRHAIVTADAAKDERIGQRAAAAKEGDRMVAGQRNRNSAAQVLLGRNSIQP